MSVRTQTADTQLCVVNDHVLRGFREDELFQVVTGSDEAVELRTKSSCSWSAKLAGVYTASYSVSHMVLTDEDWVTFQRLVAQWHVERGTVSSPVYMAMCASYQRIMGMGPKRAIPLILKQLELEGDDPDHWFWALHHLTNADPVHPVDRGNMKKMRDAWIRWGRDNKDGW
jgi:hypothetical protein